MSGQCLTETDCVTVMRTTLQNQKSWKSGGLGVDNYTHYWRVNRVPLSESRRISKPIFWVTSSTEVDSVPRLTVTYFNLVVIQQDFLDFH